MSKLVILAFDIFFDEVVLALVAENNVNFFGGVSADVRPEHNVVLGISVHIFGGDVRGEDLKSGVKSLYLQVITKKILI